MNDRPKFSPVRLRAARGERSIEELAVAAQVSSVTIRNWEAGRGEPDASPLAGIAAFVGKPLDYFFEPEPVPVRVGKIR